MIEHDVFNKDMTSTLGELDKLVKKFKNMGMTDEAKMPLTYIIQALYPNVPKNLEKNMKDTYQEGYIEGYKAGKGDKNDKGN